MTAIQTQSQRVGVVVNGRDSWRDALRDELRTQLEGLGLLADEVALVELTSGDPLDGLAAVLYLHGAGTPSAEPSTAQWLTPFVEDELCIPVVEGLGDASGLPDPVNRMNAVAVASSPGHTDRVDHVVRELLTTLLLRRRSRKVFLSYRRTDSQAVANSLLSRLSHARYQAFLDTAALQVGVRFQKRLMEWLYDCDLVVVLGSPRLSESEWVQKEIQAARTAQVGLVVVRWPEECFDGWRKAQAATPNTTGVTVFDPLTLVDADQLEQLTLTDFVNGTGDKADELKPAALARVLERIESKRLLAILERTRSLISRVQWASPGGGAQADAVQGSIGDFRQQNPSTRELTCIRVFPFRPDVESLHAFAEDTRAERPERLLALHYDVDDDATAPIRWMCAPLRHDLPRQVQLQRWMEADTQGATP